MDPYDLDQMRLAQKRHRNWLAQASDPGYSDPQTEEPTMLDTYIAQAMRTNSTVTGTNPSVSPDLLHAALGLCDEHFEYDMAKSWLNAVEELGDFCWFIALAGHDLGCDPFKGCETFIDIYPDSMLLTEALAEFVSLVKKAYAYGAILDAPALRQLLRIMAGRIAKIVVAKSDRSMEELLTANIDKLKARFPEKFEVEYALNRDIKQEAGVMRAVLH